MMDNATPKPTPNALAEFGSDETVSREELLRRLQAVRSGYSGLSLRCMEAEKMRPAPTIPADDAALVKRLEDATADLENAIRRIEALAAEKRESDERIAAVLALESFGATVELRTKTGSGAITSRGEVECVSAAMLRAALTKRGATDA